MKNYVTNKKIEALKERIEQGEFVPKTKFMNVKGKNITPQEYEKAVENNEKYIKEMQNLNVKLDKELLHACGLNGHKKGEDILEKAWHIIKMKSIYNQLAIEQVQSQVLQELSEFADLIL